MGKNGGGVKDWACERSANTSYLDLGKLCSFSKLQLSYQGCGHNNSARPEAVAD